MRRIKIRWHWVPFCVFSAIVISARYGVKFAAIAIAVGFALGAFGIWQHRNARD